MVKSSCRFYQEIADMGSRLDFCNFDNSVADCDKCKCYTRMKGKLKDVREYIQNTVGQKYTSTFYKDDNRLTVHEKRFIQKCIEDGRGIKYIEADLLNIQWIDAIKVRVLIDKLRNLGYIVDDKISEIMEE